MALTATVGYTVVSASNLRDSTGTPIANATIYFSPVDNKGNALSYKTGGASPGPTSSNQVSALVTNGEFQILLADPNLTTPLDIGYAVTIIDNVTGNSLLGPGYGCVQWPTGLAFDFDTYDPDLAAQVTVQNGPSAYDVAVENGFVGTEAQWLASLVGPTGLPGASSISLPIYATTAAGVAAGTGVAANGYFMVPAASASDSLYDVYQNVSSVAVHLSAIPAQTVTSESDGLYIVDEQGYYVKLYDFATKTFGPIESRLENLESAVFDNTALISTADGLYVGDGQGFVSELLKFADGSSAVYDKTYGLQDKINALNQTCLAFSASLRGSFNPTMETFRFALNFVIAYGQSLMAGYQCNVAYDTVQTLGNLCIGTQVRFNTSTGASLPTGDALNHPCVEAYNSAGPAGDTGLSAFCNFAKQLLNTYMRVANDTSRVFLASNVSCPGQPISALMPGATPDASGQNLWSRVVRSAGYAKANAATANQSIGAVAFIYDQGEQDSGAAVANNWAANLISMRATYDALMASEFGQTNQAGIYTYQTGGAFETDASGLDVGMAQWTLAKTQPNWFLFGPHYPYPDFGGHKTANSYRWMMAMAAKVWFRTAVLRQGWLPLGPHKCVIAGNTLLIGYHVPVPPLTVATAYNIATPENFTDLGFTLFDAKGWISATYSVVADTVVQCVPDRVVDWSTAYLRYADLGDQANNGSPRHGGRGNIADSDSMRALMYVAPDGDDAFLPVTTPAQPAAAYDIVGLSGLPYNLQNWSVAFQISPATFEG